MKYSLFLTVLVAGLVCDGALVAQKDILVTRDGRRIRGAEVTAMTSRTIHYQRSGTDLELPASLLAEVQWADPPEEFGLARGAARNGDFAAAANLYSAAADKASRDILKSEATFLAAESLARDGAGDPARAQAAAEKLNAWLTAHPDHFRVPDALLALGRAQVAAGAPAEAEATFEKLAQDALSSGWSPLWNARAKFEQAKALVAKGDHGNARAAFRAAISAAQTVGGENAAPEVVVLIAEASVGVGEAMIEEKNFDEALRYFQDLGRREQGAVQAAAKAGEGEALFLEAADQGDVEGLRAAQVALAEANLLDPTGGVTTAKALYYSGRVLLALGPDNEASNYKQRAADYFDTVLKEYSSTRWAAAAAAAARN